MSLHRTKATLIGLLEAGRANEWVVTEKLGDSQKNKANAKDKPVSVKAAVKKARSKIVDRYYLTIFSRFFNYALCQSQTTARQM